MQTNIKVALILFLGVVFVFAAVPQAFAQQTGLEYQLLEKIPGTNGLGGNLPDYISALYKIALVIVTLSAVLMLSIGGFMYLTSAGNTSSIGTAKSIITDSLIGLVIALSAWLVLYVINPDLVELNMGNLSPMAASSLPGNTPATPQGTGSLPPMSSVDLAKEILGNNNIKLAGDGDCKSPSGKVTPLKNIQDVAAGKRMAACYESYNCASKGDNGCADDAVRPSETMLKAIATVGKTMAFTINSISGGPHAPNSKHYTGNAIDINGASQAIMDAFVQAGAVRPNGTPGSSMCEKPIKNAEGKIIRTESVDCTTGGANHMHIIFPL